MPKLVLSLIFLLFFGELLKGQSYTGIARTFLHVHSAPNKDSAIVDTVKKKDLLFIISDSVIKEDYYHVINIRTNTQGYVYEEYVEKKRQVSKNERDAFIPDGKFHKRNPSVHIHNDSDKPLKLLLNAKEYTFAPGEKRMLALSPGRYRYIASAPGVIPDYGTDKLKKFFQYKWRFYIKNPEK